MADIRSSVVLVTGSDPEERRFGTGFVVGHDAEETLVVTCAHVTRDVGGPDKVRIGGEPATVVALADGGWPDLAVLRTPAAADAPALEVAVGGGRGDAFESAGFQLYGGEHLIRRISGRLGEQLGLESPRSGDRIRAFELALDGSSRLQPGYSGAPVIGGVDGAVTAVVSHREGDGTKGMAVAVEALRLIWPDFDRFIRERPPRAARPRRDGLTLEVVRERTSLFVGREDELAQLEGKFDAIRRSAGAVGFIIGEAGTGKSTLVLKLIRKILEEFPDCVFALARVDIVSGTHTSYAPFKSVMEQILLADQTAVIGDGQIVRPIDIVAETLRDMGIRRLGPMAAFTGIATEVLQSRLAVERPDEGSGWDPASSFDQGMLFDCYANAIRNVAVSFPLVMVLDDIHWSDDSSLLLLQHLGQVIEFHGVMILATYRPEEAAGRVLIREVEDRLVGLGAFCIDLQRKEMHQRDPLGRNFCSAYLRARYGTQFSDRFLGFIASLTGGNPLFLAETLTNLEEKGGIVQIDGEWVLLKPVDAMSELPTRIEHVISQRVNRLDQSLLTILKHGSVEGEVFTAEVVACLEHVEDRELLHTVIDKLMRVHRLVIAVATQRLLSGKSLHTFGFRHVLTQRYVYEYVLTDIERELLHEELAACLVSVSGTVGPELLPRLATHYSLAGVPDKTIQYALPAGEGYLAEYGWSEATRFGRLGLRMLEAHPELGRSLPAETLVRLRLLYAKGELEGGVAGEPIDHVQTGIDTLLPCVDHIGAIEPRLAVDVYLTLGRLAAIKAVVTDFHANAYVREAIRIAEEAGDKRALVEALSIYHVTTNVADQSMAAEQLAARKRCVELAEELADPILLAESLSRLAVHYVVFDTDEENPLALAEEYAQRALGIAQRQNIIAELNAREVLSWAYHHRGYYGERLETFRREMLELARHHGQTHFEADALTDLGHYYSFFIGDEDTSMRIKREAYDFRVQMGRHPVIDTEHLAELQFRLGRFDESRKLLGRFLDRQDEQRAARARGLVARALALTGRDDDALAMLADLEEVVRAGSNLVASVHAAAMTAYAMLERPEDALRHAERIRPTIPAAGRRGQFWTYLDYPTALAEVYRLAGDLTAATDWVETAAGYWSELSSVTDVSQLVMFAEHEFVRAKVFADLGRDDAARPLLERVRVAFRRSRHYLLAEALLVLGAVARRQGDLEESRAWVRESAERAEELGLRRVARRARELADG